MRESTFLIPVDVDPRSEVVWRSADHAPQYWNVRRRLNAIKVSVRDAQGSVLPLNGSDWLLQLRQVGCC